MTASTAAHHGDDGSFGTFDEARLEASFFHAVNDVVYLFTGSAFLHVDDHCFAHSIFLGSFFGSEIEVVGAAAGYEPSTRSSCTVACARSSSIADCISLLSAEAP